MNVNGKNISTKAELLQTINEGVNILDYIKDEKDIDFVTNAIIIEPNRVNTLIIIFIVMYDRTLR